MYQLAFSAAHSYANELDGITVPVVLEANGKRVRFAASVDTGAAFCIFRKEVADDLGLDPASAARKRFRTANSAFEALGHEVQISVLGVSTYAMVYFFADEEINKNVLGRAGWLDRVRVGLVDHDSMLYVAPYNAE